MGQNLKEEGQRGKLDKNEFVHFKFWPDQPQKRSFPLLLQIFSLLEKKKMALELGLENNDSDGRDWAGGDADPRLSSGREGT